MYRMTQHQFAKKANLSRTAILYLETNRSIPYRRTIAKLSQAYPKLKGVFKIYEQYIYD